MTKEQIAKRREIEMKIMRRTVEDLIKFGYELAVHNSESQVSYSMDVETVLKAMKSTDEEYLYVHTLYSPLHIGWVFFVYGNDGFDVISDYTTSLEHIMSPVLEFADTLDDRGQA